MAALINRFLYPSSLSPACKYMQIQKEWVEPKAWWASSWTRLISLLRFFHRKVSHVPREQSPERSRHLRVEPADLGSNPSPNPHCPVPSWARPFLSEGGVLTAPRGNTAPGGFGTKEAGALELTGLLQRPPSSELGISAHHAFLRLPEKSALSPSLQPRRARAPWKESCDFLNEWHALPNRVLAPSSGPVKVRVAQSCPTPCDSCALYFMCDLCRTQPLLWGRE